jgi:hypothetical protein
MYRVKYHVLFISLSSVAAVEHQLYPTAESLVRPESKGAKWRLLA